MLHFLTRYGDSRFHFIFSSHESGAGDVGETLRQAIEIYRQTRRYRDLAIRGTSYHTRRGFSRCRTQLVQIS